jgi:hypothetical protein
MIYYLNLAYESLRHVQNSDLKSKQVKELLMIRINKHPLVLRVGIVIASFVFAAVGFSANANPARIIPKGTVSVIKDDRVMGEFTREAPLPEGSLLRCEGQCTVRMNDASMVAEPGTIFSLSPMADIIELLIQKGTVYFSINESSRPIQFNTPAGVVSPREVSLTDGELKGYVRVSGNEAEVGVIGGGTMIVDTPKGEMALLPGKKVALALIDPRDSISEVAGGAEGSSLARDVTLGVIGTAVIVGGIYAIDQALKDNDSGGGGGSGSPASP